MDVFCFKFPGGEEVVAKASISEQWFLENALEIYNAITFIPTQQGVGAAPWPTIGENETVVINCQQLLAVAKVKEEVKMAYVKATSGIDIPSINTSKLMI